MASRLTIVVTMSAVLLGAATISSAEEPLNLLFFGNSFTIGSNIPWRVGNIAAADGHAGPLVVADLGGGRDLDNQYSRVTNYPANNVNHSSIAGDTWDFVIMQGHSTEATHLSSDDFEGDMLRLYQAVLNHNSGHGAGVTGVLYQTWARYDRVAAGNFPSLTAMQNEITVGYAAAASLLDSAPGTVGPTRIATVGQGFQEVNFDTSLYDGAGYHLVTKGYTASALTIYRTIYNEDVSDIPYSAVSSWVGLGESDWNEITAIADGAPVVVPEPATMGLLALSGLALLRRKQSA